MHPGMPPGRNHFRRTRDAPMWTLPRVTHASFFCLRGFSERVTAECQPMSKSYYHSTELDGESRAKIQGLATLSAAGVLALPERLADDDAIFPDKAAQPSRRPNLRISANA